MFRLVSLSLRQTFSVPFRQVFWKSLGVTLVLLTVLWMALGAFFDWLIVLPQGWLDGGANVLVFLVGFVLMAFLVAPVTALVAGFFQDDIAALVEQRSYPDDPPGRSLSFKTALREGVRFLLAVAVANMLALVLLLIPGVNLIVFLAVNGYLLGREYFQFAARRHVSESETRRLRTAHAPQILTAGLVIAIFIAVPILNLATPIFATVLMMHLTRAWRITAFHSLDDDRSSGGPRGLTEGEW